MGSDGSDGGSGKNSRWEALQGVLRIDDAEVEESDDNRESGDQEQSEHQQLLHHLLPIMQTKNRHLQNKLNLAKNQPHKILQKMTRVLIIWSMRVIGFCLGSKSGKRSAVTRAANQLVDINSQHEQLLLMPGTAATGAGGFAGATAGAAAGPASGSGGPDKLIKAVKTFRNAAVLASSLTAAAMTLTNRKGNSLLTWIKVQMKSLNLRQAKEIMQHSSKKTRRGTHQPLPIGSKAGWLAKELKECDYRGYYLKGKALILANDDVSLVGEDRLLADKILKCAKEAEDIMQIVADDSNWMEGYDNKQEQFITMYQHHKGSPVHAVKMKAVFNSSAASALSVLREFDLTGTWNDQMKGCAQLGFPSQMSVQAYGAGFMPWGPFKTRDVLFNGYGVDALDEHGCITLIFQSTKTPLCALPSISKKCVRAEFLRSGVILEPLPAVKGAEKRVLASLVLYGDPKMPVVPGWLAGFGLKVFAPMVKRKMDDLFVDIETNPASPYALRKKEYPKLYGMLDGRVEQHLSRSARAPPRIN